MVIRITQTKYILLENVLFTSIDLVKTKGGPEVPIHTVTVIGGKNFVVTDLDAIKILFPENNAAQAFRPQQSNNAVPQYAEDINAPEEYVVLKSFNTANDPSLRVEEKTVLKKAKVAGINQWIADHNPKIMFNYVALQNTEYFGLPGQAPTTSVNEAPTPKVEKK